MKHHHRWTGWVTAQEAVTLRWLSPGTHLHGYARKCIGHAGGCGLVESKRII